MLLQIVIFSESRCALSPWGASCYSSYMNDFICDNLVYIFLVIRLSFNNKLHCKLLQLTLLPITLCLQSKDINFQSETDPLLQDLICKKFQFYWISITTSAERNFCTLDLCILSYAIKSRFRSKNSFLGTLSVLLLTSFQRHTMKSVYGKANPRNLSFPHKNCVPNFCLSKTHIESIRLAWMIQIISPVLTYPIVTS